MAKIKEIISYAFYHMIAKHMPKSNAKITFGAKTLRRLCAKGMGVKCGKKVNIQKGAIFSNDLIIGDRSGVGVKSVISSKVTIGKDVMIGPECHIYTTYHDFSRLDVPMIEQGYKEPRPVVIEDDVWIGSRVTIMGGVTIGAHSVIGAGAVVTKSVPEYSVVGGNPAKILYNRKEREEEKQEK